MTSIFPSTCVIRFGSAGLAIFVALLSAASVRGQEIPPVNWGGSIGYQFLTSRTPGEGRQFQNALNTSLFADSYIWQPWFMTVGGSANLAQFWSSSEDSDAATQLIAGRFNMSFLPFSNYPTSFAYSHSDNRVEFDTDSNVLKSDTFDLNSRIHWDETLDLQSNLNYSLSTQTDGGDQENAAVLLTLDKRFTEHDLNVRLSHRQHEKEATSTNDFSRDSAQAIAVRHRYSPWKNTTYDSTTNAIYSEDEDSAEESQEFLVQATTTIRWAPDEYPMTVTGILRTLSRDEDTDFTAPASTAGVTSQNEQSVSARGGIHYRFSPQLVANGSLRASYEAIETETTAGASDFTDLPTRMEYGAGAGISYTSLPEDLAGFRWNWGASGNFDINGNSETGVSANESASGSHTLAKSYTVPLLGQVNLSFGQDLLTQHESSDGLTATVGHNVRASHSSSAGATATLISASAVDSRTLIASSPTSRQLLNLQISRNYRQDANTTWSGNLTWQASRVATEDDQDAGWTNSTQGSLTFRRRRLFGIERLVFTSELQLDSNTLLPLSFSTSGDDQQDNLAWTRRWSNRLDYRIGQIVADLEFRLTQDESGDISDLLLFRIRREF